MRPYATGANGANRKPWVETIPEFSLRNRDPPENHLKT